MKFVAKIVPMKGVENIDSSKLYVLHWTDVNEISVVEYERYMEALQMLDKVKEPELPLETLLELNEVV